jgi:putative oxidoreductase
MSLLRASPSRWTPRMLSVFRIVVGLLFMLHGTQKMFGFPPSERARPFELMSQMGLAGVLETFGGALIVLGLLTRPVAFILAGEMAVAYFQAHFPRGFFPTRNGGEGAVLFCFSFLYLMLAGAGPWSVDAMLAGSADTPAARDHERERIEHAA